MVPLIRIAFRNVLVQRKRSILIGFAVMLSALLLFMADSTMNGVEGQVLRGYMHLQSGHVAVVWEGMKEIDGMDTSRFLSKLASFNPAKKAEAKQAMDRLNQFLKTHADEVALFDATVRKYVRMRMGTNSGSVMVYGLTEATRQHLLDERTIAMEEGELPVASGRALALSREFADQNKVKLGDEVTLETVTANGESKEVAFVVKGIYANGAGYDNGYAFMPAREARDLLGYEEGYFDAARIYLKDLRRAEQFAKELDAYLLAESPMLRAESYKEASSFYTTTPKNLKLLFNLFVVFLLYIIGMGLRSTIGITLFQRMREFGTIRAIGFSKWQNYTVVLMEVLILSLMSLAIAFSIALGFTLFFGEQGVYVGPGPISYAMGGESFYPEMKVTDVVFVVLVITGFALGSTLGPGLRMSGQNITDLLANRMRKMSLMKVLWSGVSSPQRKVGQ